MNGLFSDVPEGTYTCKILDITTKPDAKNRMRMLWTLQVTEGPYQSCEIEKKFYLTSPKAVECLKNELKILGIEAKDGQDFEVKKPGLIGKRIIIETDINDHGFHVYYIKGYAAEAEKKQEEMAAIGW